MLYEQQKVAGIRLTEIERKVSYLRQKFTTLVLQKHYWETEKSVDRLFNENSNAEVTNILKTIEKKNIETKLSNQFDDMMTLGAPGSKMSEPLLSTPGRFTMNEASRQKKKANLTERLHRGTQASVKLGRRQMQSRDIFQPYRTGDAPLEYEEHATTPGPSRLGKRNFLSSHLPLTPTRDN